MDMLIVQSKVKEAVKKHDLNMAGDFADGLSKEVDTMIRRAGMRAKANGRKTLRAADL